MLYGIDGMIEQVADYIRVRELAYFYCHKELLEDKYYHCAYRLLRIGHIKKYSFMTVDSAIRCAENDIIEMVQNYEKEKIEAYRTTIDQFTEAVKFYNMCEKIDKLTFIEY